MRAVQLVVGWSYLASAKVTTVRGKKLARLAKASQILAYMGYEQTLRSEFDKTAAESRTADSDINQTDQQRYGSQPSSGVEDFVTLPTSLLLKAPGENGELGVLYASFEYNWLKLLAHRKSKEFFERYLLVGASSWSPTNFAILQSFQRNAPHPAFIGISNRADMVAYEAAGSGIRPLELMACDWVDPGLYAPKPLADRDIDLLMVAPWDPFKRLDLLFRILRRMPADLRVALVGRDTAGRTAQSMREMARNAGCPQELTIHTRIPNRQVNELQTRSRAAIITIIREGSCVSVTEAFAANTPVALMRGAHVGAAAYINSSTGRFLDMDTAHLELQDMIANPAQFTPRAWMISNCTAQLSSQKLNVALREYCASKNIPWTTDIVPLRWAYVPAYLNDDDRLAMQHAVATLKREFGVELVEYPAVPGLVG